MAGARPPIPAEMQRNVRRRCGFGCVVCGLPLYEIHHVHGFNPARGHIEAELTLLCDMHHKEAGNGLLTVEQVVAADQDPMNTRRGWSAPWGGLHFEGASFVVEIGGNHFEANHRDPENHLVMVPIAVDNTNLIVFRVSPDGEVLVHITAFDEFNRPILIVDGNTIVHSIVPWDIRLKAAD